MRSSPEIIHEGQIDCVVIHQPNKDRGAVRVRETEHMSD